jgi:hypothetical protein
MEEPGRFNVVVSVPMDHPTPFNDVINQVSSMGLAVDPAHTAPEIKTLVGSATDDVYRRLQAVPGLHVSRERSMGFA